MSPASSMGCAPPAMDFAPVAKLSTGITRRSPAEFEQHLDSSGVARVLEGQDGLLPALERKTVGDHRGEVESGGDEVEIVLHRVLGDPADFLDSEPVRADDMQLLEIQRCPPEPPRPLDAGDHDLP